MTLRRLNVNIHKTTVTIIALASTYKNEISKPTSESFIIFTTCILPYNLQQDLQDKSSHQLKFPQNIRQHSGKIYRFCHTLWCLSYKSALLDILHSQSSQVYHIQKDHSNMCWKEYFYYSIIK